MAKFVALIYGDQGRWDSAPPEWHEENGRHHAEFIRVAGEAVIGGHELESSQSARTIRRSPAGQQVVFDGPFTESKECIGGFYLLVAADMDEAVRLAQLLPEASTASSGVEVRRLL